MERVHGVTLLHVLLFSILAVGTHFTLDTFPFFPSTASRSMMSPFITEREAKVVLLANICHEMLMEKHYIPMLYEKCPYLSAASAYKHLLNVHLPLSMPHKKLDRPLISLNCATINKIEAIVNRATIIYKN